MTSYTDRNIERFHSSDSLAGSGAPGRWSEDRHGHERVREAERPEAFSELRLRVGRGDVDAELDEQRLDEPRVAALVHARERPPHHARPFGLRPFLRRGREPRELREETALPDPGLACDEHHLGVAEPARLIREIESAQLHPATDERCGDVDDRTAITALTGERVHEDRLLFALDLDRADLAERELTVRETERGLRDVDLARSRGRLDALRGVHRVAHDAVLGDGADRAGDDDAGAQAELDAAFLHHARGVVGEGALHAQRGAQSALRIVLVCYGRAEDDEDRVADELLDGAVVGDGLFGKVLEDAGHQDLELLRVHLVRQLGESREVCEEDRDEAAFLRLFLHAVGQR